MGPGKWEWEPPASWCLALGFPNPPRPAFLPFRHAKPLVFARLVPSLNDMPIKESLPSHGTLKAVPARSAAFAAAVVGASSVAIGAFGAHALNGFLLANDRLDTWETAVLYHLAHSVLLVLIATRVPFRPLPFGLCLGGILLFSGSLYLLCLTSWTRLGAITPLGGILLIAAWISLIRPPRSSPSD